MQSRAYSRKRCALYAGPPDLSSSRQTGFPPEVCVAGSQEQASCAMQRPPQSASGMRSRCWTARWCRHATCGRYSNSVMADRPGRCTLSGSSSTSLMIGMGQVSFPPAMSLLISAPAVVHPVSLIMQVGQRQSASSHAASIATGFRPVHGVKAWKASSHCLQRRCRRASWICRPHPPHASTRSRKARRHEARSASNAAGRGASTLEEAGSFRGAQFRQHQDSRPLRRNASASPSPQHGSVAWNHPPHEAQLTPYSTTLRQSGHTPRSCERRQRRRIVAALAQPRRHGAAGRENYFGSSPRAAGCGVQEVRKSVPRVRAAAAHTARSTAGGAHSTRPPCDPGPQQGRCLEGFESNSKSYSSS
mmetsp:Transcript_17681/g.55853  ORF Transcript_17681/g.55853 Transcript_17681/m.55853 type:complete len:361 (-) Transcript_17681:2597-3679(-)